MNDRVAKIEEKSCDSNRTVHNAQLKQKPSKQLILPGTSVTEHSVEHPYTVSTTLSLYYW